MCPDHLAIHCQLNSPLFRLSDKSPQWPKLKTITSVSFPFFPFFLPHGQDTPLQPIPGETSQSPCRGLLDLESVCCWLKEMQVGDGRLLNLAQQLPGSVALCIFALCSANRQLPLKSFSFFLFAAPQTLFGPFPPDLVPCLQNSTAAQVLFLLDRSLAIVG